MITIFRNKLNARSITKECCARAVAAISLVILLSACGSAPEGEYVPVTLNGQVKMMVGPTPSGTLHFRLYNLMSLEGEMRHPLEEIEDFESDSPNFTHSFEYPAHKGEGLAIHAWLDADADGIFCTPDARLDPSGLSYMEESPAGEINMVITLTDNCRAANYFYPPAP